MFDILVGTEIISIAKADSVRTVQSSPPPKSPTGRMVTDPSIDFPKMPIFMRAIESKTRRRRTCTSTRSSSPNGSWAMSWPPTCFSSGRRASVGRSRSRRKR